MQATTTTTVPDVEKNQTDIQLRLKLSTTSNITKTRPPTSDLPITGTTTSMTAHKVSTTAECIPTKKLVFLKTHKTGSETMAGIFRRYAIMNNVSTLMSTRFGGHLYSQNSHHTYDPISKRHLKMIGANMPNAHYELVTNHMTYNKSFINDYFDPKETKKITILRNPA